MPTIESKLVIGAKDETGGAFAAIKTHIAALDKSIATFDKLAAKVNSVAKANDPMIASIDRGARALKEERDALEGLSRSMMDGVSSAEGMAEAQARLAAEVSKANRVLVTQGETAGRVSQQIARAQEQSRKSFREKFGEALPFAGPGILRGTEKAVEAGGTVDEEIARLRAAGSTNEQITQARSDFRDFSKTHSGVLESEYLAGFRDARVIAPGESFEMARLGATYRAAARNSGLSTSEFDVGNVLRIMDELGLKSNPEREDFLNNFLKSQQAFGSQISTETALAAYRNAKQSIYDWSPEFRNKYFPTLLQSSGQQGGVEMMTALSNYVGGHMQQSELRALASAGFVQNKDLIYNKIGDVKGLKPGAQLFEQDLFKTNIAQWAWNFRDTYMQRKGATEDKFENLIDRMPRNMAALIAFLNHNRGRIQRDAATLDLPVGLAAASDTSLGGNSPAALSALKDALTQFGAAVTSPAVAAAGPALQSLAHAVQTVSAATGQFAKEHPEAATAGSAGAIAGVSATGLWLTGKLFGLVKGWLGLGGNGAGASAAAAGAGGTAGGSLARIIGGAASAASLPGVIDLLTDDNRTDAAKANDAAVLGKLKSWFAPTPLGPPMPMQGRDVHGPSTGPYAYFPGRAGAPQGVTVSGQAQVDHTVRLDLNVTLDPALRAKIDQIANDSREFTVPLIGGGSGRMDSDAGPHRSGGIGRE